MRGKILITGGAGFIGAHLVESLRDGCDIVIFDNFRRNSLQFLRDSFLQGNVRLIEGDVLDSDALARAMAGADAVLHLAAIAGVSSYYKDPAQTLRVNILGTVNVLEAMRQAGARRIIDFSTSEVYGVHADNVHEECPHGIGPVSQRRWAYAVSKLASEHFTLHYGDDYGFESTCVRPFNIYGARQTGEGCISNFCSCLRDGKPLVVHGHGHDVRAWCHVSDMVEAIRLILETPESVGKTFNIGNPAATANTLELARLLIGIHGRGEIQFIESPHDSIPVRVPNIDRARSILGFEPKVTLAEGLAQTLDWYTEAMSCAS